MTDQLHRHAEAHPARMKERGAGRADGMEALCVHHASSALLKADHDAYAVSPEEQTKIVACPAAKGQQLAVQQALSGGALSLPAGPCPVVKFLSHGLPEHASRFTRHKFYHAVGPVKLPPV